MKTRRFDETRKETIFDSKATIIDISIPKEREGMLKLGPDSGRRDKSRLVEMIKLNSETSPLHGQVEASRSNSSRLPIFEQEDSIPDSGTPVKERKPSKFIFMK